MYLMKDITRDGNPVLRKRAAKVSFPLSDEDQKLAKDMMKYLEVSQDPELCEKYKLRAGVGLAAPQVGVSKQMAAVLVPAPDEDEKPLFKDDKDVPGYVPRHDRITLRYQDVNGETHKVRLKHYPAIVCQHEIDHLHGVLFYDHINKDQPFEAPADTVMIS